MRRDSWRWMHIALAIWIGAGTASAADAPPNFLVVIADDCSYSELPLFGGRNVRTPHIDRLADDGILFRRAYVSMSMCVPCRAELYTGLYPLRSGVAWNHSSARAGTVGIVQRLEPYGYRTGIAGKVHAPPRSVFPFELSNLARDPAHAARRAALAAELDRWIAQQADPGVPLDTQEAFRRGRDPAREPRR